MAADANRETGQRRCPYSVAGTRRCPVVLAAFAADHRSRWRRWRRGRRHDRLRWRRRWRGAPREQRRGKHDSTNYCVAQQCAASKFLGNVGHPFPPRLRTLVRRLNLKAIIGKSQHDRRIECGANRKISAEWHRLATRRNPAACRSPMMFQRRPKAGANVGGQAASLLPLEEVWRRGAQSFWITLQEVIAYWFPPSSISLRVLGAVGCAAS